MNCLKCGKEAPESQVFCNECLETMQQYPVNPGTAIHIPQRTAQHQESSASESISAEEEALRLRRMVRWLTGIVAVLAVLLLVFAGLLLHDITKPASSNPSNIGKNYTTISPGNAP